MRPSELSCEWGAYSAGLDYPSDDEANDYDDDDDQRICPAFPLLIFDAT